MENKKRTSTTKKSTNSRNNNQGTTSRSNVQSSFRTNVKKEPNRSATNNTRIVIKEVVDNNDNKKRIIIKQVNDVKSNNVNRPVNTNQIKKRSNNSSYTIGDIILVIVLIAVLFFIFRSCTNKNNQTDNSKEPNSKEENPKEENPKLKELNYINEKLDFFKMEYIDRYIDYKNKNKDLDLEKVIIYVNIGLDNDYYTNVNESPNKYTDTVLTNKYNYLGDDYVPKNLTLIDKKYAVSEGKYMEQSAQEAFTNLAQAAREEGYTILASSTYRSYSYQTGLYNRYKEQDGIEKADTYSARAGYSEHQTGLAVDVSNGDVSYTRFGDTEEFNWMQENAYKYGFILRYTEETEFITGYINEPWHYRYVGKEIAEYIHNNPMTYEEYYVRFLDK